MTKEQIKVFNELLNDKGFKGKKQLARCQRCDSNHNILGKPQSKYSEEMDI